ncbi:Uncharacterised protein [Legionella busanensis]|uniref:Uncharacterized protein n=1 Tax=Legionella busanensis TaxID=190655 RepID=A0A378JIG3_9GAMM|nr:RAQPRD family integrative conjugative element protein [Legionella busanensis]STX50934.1 Uncharacterised protein [Legionella busanensis]
MKYWLLLSALIFNTCLYASEAALNKTLVRVINQINAIMPLLDEANNEIEPNTRLQLHIDSFKSADGNSHPGLRQDLLEIRNSLIEYINKPAIEPKTVKPLALDYIGK